MSWIRVLDPRNAEGLLTRVHRLLGDDPVVRANRDKDAISPDLTETSVVELASGCLRPLSMPAARHRSPFCFASPRPRFPGRPDANEAQFIFRTIHQILRSIRAQNATFSPLASK